MKHYLLTGISLLALLLVSPTVMAWEEDPFTNDQLSPDDKAVYGYDVQTNQNGMTYVFYQTPRTGGITMHLQILDPDGRKTQGEDGLIVSDEDNLSYTTVNQLMLVDREGNAILPVSDCRAGAKQQLYTVYKVNERGETLWTTTLNQGEVNGSIANLSVVQVADGGYVFAYFRYGRSASGTNIYYVTLEKLSEDGVSQWITHVYEEGTMISYPYLVDAGEGRVMLIYAVGTTYHLTAQLFNADGTTGWDDPLTFYTGGFSPIRAIQTALSVTQAPDGGALVAWMYITQTYESHLIWIRNDRTLAFPTADGNVLVSHEATRSRYLPRVLWNEDDGNIYLIYRQFDQGHQEIQGLYMQKISPTGDLLWGDNGLAVVEMQQESQYSYPSVQRADKGRVAVFYQSLDGLADEGAVGSYLTLFDASGERVLSPQNFSTNDDTKSSLSTTPLLDGDHYLTWWTAKTGTNTAKLMLQYVTTTGTTVSAIDNVAVRPQRDIVGRAFFNAAGQRIAAPERGLTIVRNTYSDNTTSTRKQVQK